MLKIRDDDAGDKKKLERRSSQFISSFQGYIKIHFRMIFQEFNCEK